MSTFRNAEAFASALMLTALLTVLAKMLTYLVSVFRNFRLSEFGQMKTVVIPFRHLGKEDLGIRIPPLIAQQIRLRAANERRSISEVGSEILAKGLGMDPAQFGIEAQSA